MKKIILLIIFFATFFQITYGQEGPGINPYLDKYLGQLSEEKLLFWPIFEQRFDPEEFHNFSDEMVKSIVFDSLNVFIADSGKHYKKILDPYRESQVITAEVLSSLKRVGAPELSPDGRKLLYTINTPNIKENNSLTSLYIYDFKHRAEYEVFKTEKSQYAPKWFPDSDRFVFLSTVDDTPQVYLSDTNYSKPKKITSQEFGVSNLLVSPDGKYISYTSDVKIDQTPQEKYPALDKAKVYIYEDLPIRHWDEWNDENYMHLFIQPVNGGEPIDLMRGERYDTPLKPFGGISEFAWSPDSKEIAYTAKKVDDFEWSTDSDIYIYKLNSGETVNITKGMLGFDKDPLYSPDGNWIAFHSMERAGFEADKIRVMLYNRNNGKIHELSSKLDRWIGTMIWSPDSKYIYFSAGDSAVVPIYKMDVQTGDWNIVVSRRMNFDQGLQITPDGQYLIFGGRHMMQPTELYSIRTNGEQFEKLTYVNEQVLRQLKKVDIQEKWITSTDGKKVHNWILYPPDFDETKKYPVIVYCQGGPQATISQYFSFRWNLYTFASYGYIVVAPNRRGMPGFGQDWNDAISKDWGGMPMTDIIVSTDEIAKEPYVKKDGIAAVGASAGGYAAFWLAGNHEGRYSAFLSHCGVYNVVSKYGSTEELWFPNWEFGGPYWEEENKQYYDKFSPHHYANNWDTPIIISVGVKDYRVPYTQSLEAFTVAQVKNIPSKLLVFPEQNHWILKPQESILWFKEVFDFLDRHCNK